MALFAQRGVVEQLAVPDGETADVAIYNLAGSLLLSTTSEKPINLSRFERGTYIVKVVRGATSESFKIVKM